MMQMRIILTFLFFHLFPLTLHATDFPWNPAGKQDAELERELQN
jgi:hypothetical protein